MYYNPRLHCSSQYMARGHLQPPVGPGFFLLYLSSTPSFLYFGSSSHRFLSSLASSVHPFAHAVLFPWRLWKVSSLCPHCLRRTKSQHRHSKPPDPANFSAITFLQSLLDPTVQSPIQTYSHIPRDSSPNACASPVSSRDTSLLLALIPFGKCCLVLQDLIKLLPFLGWPSASYLSFVAHTVPRTLSILVPMTSHLLFICLSQPLIPGDLKREQFLSRVLKEHLWNAWVLNPSPNF